MIRKVVLIPLLITLSLLAQPVKPKPNARVPLYLMGPPSKEKMKIALMSEVVEVEGEHSQLIRAGVKPIFYDWLFARYGDEMNSSYLVPFQGPYGKALAYDYGSEKVRRWRVRELVDRMVRENYTGVFFDWFPNACNEELAEEEAPGYLEEFKRRHPNLTLKEALLSFIRELREEAKKRGIDIIIVSNQAYRCDPEAMASVDWDISESYFTDVRESHFTTVDGRTVLFPWEQSWDSPALYVPLLVSSKLEEARKLNFRLGFTHLSYAIPGDVDAAFYAFAGAMVFGHDGIAQSPFEGDVVYYPPPNSYWLGCMRKRINSSQWAMSAYDLGLVAAGQVRFVSPFKWLVYDLKTGEVKRLGLIGGEKPWGSVFLRVPEKVAYVSCKKLNLPLWDDMLTEHLLKSLRCPVKVRKASVSDLKWWSSWREPNKEVLIVANDIDWELSGRALYEELTKEGIKVDRAPLNGSLMIMLDYKAVIVLGGPKSPVIGEVLKPLLSHAKEKGILGPGRLFIWIWGKDRFETRKKTLDRMEEVKGDVKKVLVRPCRW